MGIEARPDAAKANGVGGEQDVLGCGREVLLPQRGVLAVEESLPVAAYSDSHRRCRSHLGVWEGVGQGLEHLGVIDNYEFPRLAVDACGRAHGRPQQGFLLGIGDRRLDVSAHAGAREYVLVCGIAADRVSFHIVRY